MPERKKLILIGSVPPPYHGSSLYFSSLLNSKIKDEFDVSHLDISDHRDLNNLSKLDITNVRLAFKNIFLLYKMLERINPDLVYVPVASNFLPYLRDGLFIFTSAYFSKAKIVIHLHEGNYFRNEFYTNSNYFVKYFIRKSLSKVDTAIVLGDRLKNTFEGLVKNIASVPNGIDLEIQSEIVDKGKIKDNIIIGFLGNLFESKGVLDVLAAAEIIIQKYRDVVFEFAGAWSLIEGNTKQKAGLLIKEKKLKDNVKFSGVLTGEKKKDFLKRIDVLVFPTWYKYEGFGIVIIEAMSAGVPVISSNDVGTIPDIILDGKTGILIEKKNPEQLAEAIIKLIEDPELRKQMGSNGRQRYNEFYTLDININKMINVFNKVLN